MSLAGRVCLYKERIATSITSMGTEVTNETNYFIY